MQANKIPLAYVHVGNAIFHIYTHRTETTIEATAYSVTPNDYTGTNLEDLYPQFEEQIYQIQFGAHYRSDVEIVRSIVGIFFDQVMSSTEVYDTGTRFNCEYVYYSPSKVTTIDSLHWFTGLSMYSQNTPEMVKERYPDAILIHVSEAILIMEEANIDKVAKPISKEQFWDALECLPPQNWVRREFTESFKMCEYLTGQITSIYVRIGKEYFTFHDRASMTHDQIVAKTRAGMPCQLTSA